MIEFFIKQNKQGMKFFYGQNEKFPEKLRSRTNEIEEKVTNVTSVLQKLYENLKDFRRAINRLSSHRMHQLDGVLLNWEQRKLFDKSSSLSLSKEFALLDNLCKQLKSEYEIDLWIEKTVTDGIKVYPCYGRYPILSLYKVKGKNIERIKVNPKKREDEFVKELRGCENPFDEIEIDDLNSTSSNSGNVLTNGFAGTSRISPTIVKYINQEGSKRLFVCLPEKVDVTTFWETYRVVLRNVHQDFFGEAYRRPKEKYYKMKLLREIWTEEGMEFQKSEPIKQCKTLSDKIYEKGRVSLAPATIERYYLPTLRRRQPDAI